MAVAHACSKYWICSSETPACRMCDFSSLNSGDTESTYIATASPDTLAPMRTVTAPDQVVTDVLSSPLPAE